MKEIAILTTRDSERLFYELLAKNRSIAVKELCRKVPRKMVYRYLKNLEQIQQATGIDIFERRAALCPVTGLPNVFIEVVCCIEQSDLLVMLFTENPALLT